MRFGHVCVQSPSGSLLSSPADARVCCRGLDGGLGLPDSDISTVPKSLDGVTCKKYKWNIWLNDIVMLLIHETRAFKLSGVKLGLKSVSFQNFWTWGLTQASVLGEKLGELITVRFAVPAAAAVAPRREADSKGSLVIGRHHRTCGTKEKKASVSHRGGRPAAGARTSGTRLDLVAHIRGCAHFGIWSGAFLNPIYKVYRTCTGLQGASLRSRVIVHNYHSVNASLFNKEPVDSALCSDIDAAAYCIVVTELRGTTKNDIKIIIFTSVDIDNYHMIKV